ncbi:MAG: hypothetical protein SH859_13860 [Hyphomicrobium aestuarii]|nr:hypothetical protein [Hyphomicrobium aestuarii]
MRLENFSITKILAPLEKTGKLISNSTEVLTRFWIALIFLAIAILFGRSAAGLDDKWVPVQLCAFGVLMIVGVALATWDIYHKYLSANFLMSAESDELRRPSKDASLLLSELDNPDYAAVGGCIVVSQNNLYRGGGVSQGVRTGLIADTLDRADA